MLMNPEIDPLRRDALVALIGEVGRRQKAYLDLISTMSGIPKFEVDRNRRIHCDFWFAVQAFGADRPCEKMEPWATGGHFQAYNIEEAAFRFADCVLATVEYWASVSRRPRKVVEMLARDVEYLLSEFSKHYGRDDILAKKHPIRNYGRLGSMIVGGVATSSLSQGPERQGASGKTRTSSPQAQAS